MATATTTDRFRTFGADEVSAHVPRQVVIKAADRPPIIPWWEGPDHCQFTDCFDAAQRLRLIEDDLLAGKSVAIVLTTVVGLGLLAMAVTVLFILL